METQFQVTLKEILGVARMTSQAATMKPHCLIDLPNEDVLKLLTNCYIQEVNKRNLDFKDDERIAKKLRQVSGWLTSQDQKPSLLLNGGVGNGKTTMARAIAGTFRCLKKSADEVFSNKRLGGYSMTPEEMQESKFIMYYRNLSPPTFITAQQLAYLAKNDEPEFNKKAESKILIIDDLGCEPVYVKNYGNEITPVTDVIYKRYDTMAPTIITTNLDKEHIGEQYGQRVRDRIEEAYACLAFKNDSYRVKSKTINDE